MAKKAKKEVDSTLNLAKLSEGYVAWMERAGKSPGTCFSYSMELKVAQAELGAETLVAAITPEDIARFERCKRVTKLKSGKPKAQPSIDKTRRVLRLAMTWAAQFGYLATCPYPMKDAPEQSEPPKSASKSRRSAKATETEVPQPEAEAAADEAEAQLAGETTTA